MMRKSEEIEFNIDKASSTPLYIQVESLLRRQISARYFENASQPITEQYLEKKLNVSRNTIRQAISKLVEEGLLVKKRALGICVVNDSSKIMGETINGLSFTEAAIKRGQIPKAKLLEAKTVTPPPQVLSMLSMGNEEKVFFSRRIRFLDGYPVSITNSYIPLKLAPLISKDDFSESGTNQSLHYVLERKHNLQILKWIESIEAINIKKKDSDILKIAIGSPVMLRKDVLYSTEGKIIAYNETVMTLKYKIEGLVFKKERLETM